MDGSYTPTFLTDRTSSIGMELHTMPSTIRRNYTLVSANEHPHSIYPTAHLLFPPSMPQNITPITLIPSTNISPSSSMPHHSDVSVYSLHHIVVELGLWVGKSMPSGVVMKSCAKTMEG